MDTKDRIQEASTNLTMSQPSTKAQPSKIAEADACAIVTFRIMHPDGKPSTIKTDCLVVSKISGLKRDLKSMFGHPDSQNWYYQGELMSDDSTLNDHEIDGTKEVEIEVRLTTVRGAFDHD